MSKKQPAAGEGKKAKREAAKKAAAEKATPAPAPAPAPEPKQETQPVATNGGLPPLPKMPKSGGGGNRAPKPTKECTCGCKGQTTGAWVPGHDARARGWALRIERAIPYGDDQHPFTLADVPEMERPGAIFMLEERKKTGMTGKGMHLVKGKKNEQAQEQEQEESEIDKQVAAAIADGMSPEAAEGLRASLEAAASGE